MRPNQIGQVAKFHTPEPNEISNQLYIVTRVFTANERQGDDIKALNTSLSHPPPVNNVKLEVLEVFEVDTFDLVRYYVTNNKADYSQAKSKVVKLSVQKYYLTFQMELKVMKQMFG